MTATVPTGSAIRTRVDWKTGVLLLECDRHHEQFAVPLDSSPFSEEVREFCARHEHCC